MKQSKVSHVLSRIRFRAIARRTALAMGLVFLGACSSDPEPEVEPKVPFSISTTTGMIADVVEKVAGERASVDNLIGEGVDPHLYKPTTSDVKALQSADLVFYNGLMLEGKMGDILVRLSRSGKPVYAVTEEILSQGDYVLTDEEDHYDPHVWMDVKGWMKAVEVVKRGLSEFDPEGASIYEDNAKSYLADLAELDSYAISAIESIPQERRVLVTAHDAFSYMTRAYGLEVRGIQGISTESEAGVRDIEILVSFLVERNIPAIFVESSVSDKNIKALAEGARAKGHEVVIGGELFSDAMGLPGTYEGTYIGMIDHNVTTITRALGGKAPKGGLNGELE